MMKALSRKDINEVKLLTDDDPNLLFIPIRAYGRIELPLFFALRNRCPLNIVKLLLSKGAPHSVPGSNGLIVLTTATTMAVQELGIPKVPMFGVCAFPFVTAAGYESRPLDAEYTVSVATCLLQHGADPFERDSQGLCAVDYATKSGDSALADLMQNWAQWQDCRLHSRMGVLSLALDNSDTTQAVYDFLIPRRLLPSGKPRGRNHAS
jgi:ankyrin repeat protein